MGYQFSFNRPGSPVIFRVSETAEQFDAHGLLAQNDAPAKAGGASSDSTSAAPTLPDIGENSLLLVCPRTKHPVNPYKDCVEVAIVAPGKINPAGHDAFSLVLVAIVAVSAAVITSLVTRQFQG